MVEHSRFSTGEQTRTSKEPFVYLLQRDAHAWETVQGEEVMRSADLQLEALVDGTLHKDQVAKLGFRPLAYPVCPMVLIPVD